MSEAIVIPGCQITPTGLNISGELSCERWQSIGSALATINKRLMWVIGDWLLAGESAGYLPRGKLAEACERFGIAYDTAAQAVRVCKAFESCMRIQELSFNHHQIAAGRDDAGELLQWAAEREATVEELREEKKRRQWKVSDIEDSEGVVSDLQLLLDAGSKFKTVYADPPWSYDNQGTRASTDNHYPTMPVDDIASMPIDLLADEGALLFLWTTNGFLRESFSVIDAWGFEFKSSMVWVKPQIGIGNYVRNAHELLLIANRGGMLPTEDRKTQISWLQCDRKDHSAKPLEFRRVVERLSYGPRLELFGRQQADNWVVFGNQIKKGLL